MEPDNWRDVEAPWWVKLDRAVVHIGELNRVVEDFTAQKPYRVHYEPSGNPHEQRVRLIEDRGVPPEIGAIVGDIIHNLRSALDSAAYWLARSYSTVPWDDELERLTLFPIRELPSKFDRDFRGKSRSQIFPKAVRDALRAVQPFRRLERYPHEGGSYKDEYRFSILGQLAEASNLDKHRRIILAGWARKPPYWSSDGETRRRLTDPRADDARDVLAYQVDLPGDGKPDHDVVWRFFLAIRDPHIASTQDVVNELTRWTDHIRNWVLPLVFQIASGDWTDPYGVHAGN